MAIFVSHSRKDEELVSRVKKALRLLGRPYEAIVYEDLPPTTKQGPDWWNIRNLIQMSEIVFLFLTQNVMDSSHTRAWVEHEVAVASAYGKPLVVFQIAGSPPAVPITYWTDVTEIDPANPESILKIQAIARAHGPADLTDYPLARAIAGAAVGSIAGPLGALVGAILGGVSAPPHPLQRIPVVSCDKCGSSFRYWGAPESTFYCPHCLIGHVYRGA